MTIESAEIRATVFAIHAARYHSPQAMDVYLSMMEHTLATVEIYVGLVSAASDYEAVLMHHRDRFLRNLSLTKAQHEVLPDVQSPAVQVAPADLEGGRPAK